MRLQILEFRFQIEFQMERQIEFQIHFGLERRRAVMLEAAKMAVN